MKIETIKKGYVALVLDSASRTKLLEAFPPEFPDVIAHHITLAYGVPKPPEEELGQRCFARVVGRAIDESLEAVVVEMNGSIQRPDGRLFHVTMSLDRLKGRKPKDSNDLLTNGYEPVKAITISGTIEFFYG